MLNKNTESSQSMPDVASEKGQALSGRLDWVGMKGIEVPVLVSSGEHGALHIPAQVSAFVSLDQADARGIHMSRLFKLTQEKLPVRHFSPNLLQELLNEFLVSHQDLSQAAKVSVEFQALVERKALKSDNHGWRTYPVRFSAEKSMQSGSSKEVYKLQVVVTYSSTCPASAALARQLIQENFKQQFRQTKLDQSPLDFQNVYDWLGTSNGINATPHAQRSFATVEVEINPNSKVQFTDLIDLIEEALQTPVQTAVKREDEQEFALRNGQNLMFCEDAARRLKVSLSGVAEYLNFYGEVRHVESLHPHDAVSVFSK